MALQAGTRLGPYEILSLIGAGGMGEVYEARDTRLERNVAIKVLAPELAADPEFRGRFAHEAKTISALSHPHICGLFDIGREQGTEYLVLELLQGETLADRLARGPLPVAQVLRLGIEIAAALEAAHCRGIIHRDLKPGNVMITAAGTKLLDFGLAKHTPGTTGHALSMLATAPGPGTAQGTIVGTLQYMAPEQVQGQPADARTDVFAFGAVLHEMATGRRAFEGTTQASLIAKILETEPPVVSSLTPLVPPALDHVIRSCLAKAPGDRWDTAHDVKLQLKWIQAQGSVSSAVGPAASRKRVAGWWQWGLAGAVAGALVAAALLAVFRKSLAPAIPMRLELAFAPDIAIEEYGVGAISPDAQRFVFEATIGGNSHLFLKNLASSEVVDLTGTQGGLQPFWSPDSQSIAFFHPDGDLKQVLLPSGEVRVLAKTGYNPLGEVGTGRGDVGSWQRDVILFAHGGRLYRVAVGGGTPRLLDLLPNQKHFFAAPWLLPDAQHLLVSVDNDLHVYVASLDGHGIKKVVDRGTQPVYGGGHLFYCRGPAVFACPFDTNRLECSGAEVQVSDRGFAVSVADDGTIVYRPINEERSTMTWFDRTGRRSGTLGEAGSYQQLVLSPLGHHATVVRGGAQVDDWDLWDADPATGIFSRLTTTPGLDTDPAWSPDERTVAFSSARGGRRAPFIKDLVSGKEEPLTSFDQELVVDQWTPDGRFIIARTLGKAVYAVSLDSDRKPHMLVDTPYTEDEVHVSPDGRWVAFNADESGRWEVYLAAFPAFTSKRQISSAGGVEPQWRADGRELFYLASDGWMMSVGVNTHNGLAVSAPSRLFSTQFATNPNVPQYAVTADGQRFLGLERARPRNTFTFMLNWLNARPDATRVAHP